MVAATTAPRIPIPTQIERDDVGSREPIPLFEWDFPEMRSSTSRFNSSGLASPAHKWPTRRSSSLVYAIASPDPLVPRENQRGAVVFAATRAGGAFVRSRFFFSFAHQSCHF